MTDHEEHDNRRLGARPSFTSEFESKIVGLLEG